MFLYYGISYKAMGSGRGRSNFAKYSLHSTSMIFTFSFVLFRLQIFYFLKWVMRENKKTTKKHTCYLFKALHRINSMRPSSSTKYPLQWPYSSRSRNLMSVPQTKYRNCNTLRGVDCLPLKSRAKSLKKKQQITQRN